MLAPTFTLRVVEALFALLGAPLYYFVVNDESRGDRIFTALGAWHLAYSFVVWTIECMDGLDPISTPALWAWLFDL
jgi:hypothetical protein